MTALTGIGASRVPPARAARIGLRALTREWRAGELRVLMLAVALAVASIVSVGAFTHRLERSLDVGASDLLGADLLLAGHKPIHAAFEARARERDLEVARYTSFRSVIPYAENLQLAEVKAVSDGYPLRGQLETANTPFTVQGSRSVPPRRGEAWLDSQLASLLGAEVGARLDVGQVPLEVTAILTHEPDRGGDLFNVAPRLMMHIGDVQATGLVAPGSHVHYRMLVAGPPDSITDFREFAEARGDRDVEIQGVRDARPELRTALQRGQQFLGLASLVAVLLAGVAIGLATRRYAERHLDTAAIARCIGADSRAVMVMFASQVLTLGLLASLVGCLLGLAAQSVLASLLGSLVAADLPPPTLLPAAQGVAAGLVLVAGFALPPVARLRQVPPARVIRRDLGALPTGAALGYGVAGLAFAALVLWQAADRTLAAYVLGGGVLTVVVLALAALALVRLAGASRGRTGAAWRYALANIARQRALSVTQVVAVGVGIMVLLLLTIVRNDLLSEWRASLPDDAPNYFVINVQPHEAGPMGKQLREAGIETAALRPMVRGRLTHIDGTTVVPREYVSPRAQRLAEREFNLSWADELQADNRIVAGRWFTAEDHGKPLVSVEQDIARTLGFEVGETVTFNIAGESIEATVQSLREVDWDSFRANFFVLFAPGTIEAVPAQYITSFHLPEGEERTLVDLVRAFPGATVLDIDSLLTRVREIMDRANAAVRYVFGFTVIAGLVVMLAAIQSTQDERRRQSALLRTLGASRSRVRDGLLAEFASLGMLAGVLGALAATGIGWAVATYLFKLGYTLDPLLWLLGLAGGALGVCAAGWLGARSVLESPPAVTLREGG